MPAGLVAAGAGEVEKEPGFTDAESLNTLATQYRETQRFTGPVLPVARSPHACGGRSYSGLNFTSTRRILPARSVYAQPSSEDPKLRKRHSPAEWSGSEIVTPERVSKHTHGFCKTDPMLFEV